MPHIYRYPQAWKRQPGFHLLPPSQKTCFPSRLGKAGLISSSFCFFSFPLFIFFKSSGGQCLAPEKGGGSWLVLLDSAHL